MKADAKGILRYLNPLLIATPEATLQTQVIDLAHLQGWLVHHTRPAQNRRGQWGTPIQGDKGFPDLVLVRRPRVIFAEIKSQKGAPSAEQTGWLLELAGCPGVETHIWKPSDWPDIERTLRR